MKEENKNSSNQQSNWQKYAKKRWFYPTVYIVVAALVITVAFWMQGDQQAKIESGEYDLDQYVKYPSDEDYGVTPVTNTTELVGWPVTDSSVVTVFTPFYDPQGTEQEQEAAIVVYNNIYYQNKGIDLVMQNGEAFDVVAAMSGTVTRVDNDPQLGFVIEIEHDNNIVTHYHSLSTANVAAGDVVTKGMLLGKAGQNVYNQEAGNHVHFEIRYNDGSHMVAVNPIDYFNQPITSIPKKKSDEEDGDNGNENGDQEGNQQENENPEDNDTPNSTT